MTNFLSNLKYKILYKKHKDSSIRAEYAVFAEVKRNLAGATFMRTYVPITKNQGIREIDVLSISKFGVYIFEVKHYAGAIQGKKDASSWNRRYQNGTLTQFRNPQIQNGYHRDALSDFFHLNTVESYVVFTHPQSTLETDAGNTVLLKNLSKALAKRKRVLSRKDVRQMKRSLKKYNRMSWIRHYQHRRYVKSMKQK
ncbi:nuclease-related domain-containing protein [Erysipelothrix anatis]|uniref:nuclease-related domain-containing protein n=1 Tax=Erysipelothrix anatis TaxID=2683713 RepID=UPI00135BD7CF|nr:nuclease-related domain-containing protein [Erysipelothrix anatis]